jgi:hypothetical protein
MHAHYRNGAVKVGARAEVLAGREVKHEGLRSVKPCCYVRRGFGLRNRTHSHQLPKQADRLEE